jgi:NAD(P) transhydrogenase subunit beta
VDLPSVAWWSGKKVAMTDMPQMIALYNGMGGALAAAIAAVELYRAAFANEGSSRCNHSNVVMSLAVIGGIIGAISFSGSLIAWAKLQGVLNKTVRFGGRSSSTACCSWARWPWASIVVLHHGADPLHVTLIFVLALLFGIAMTLPIGGADMPVVISLYNALTGLAVAFEGFVMNNAAMIIAGHGGRLGRHAAHAAHGQGHEPFAGQRAVLGLRFGRRRRGHRGDGLDETHRGSDVGVMMAFASKVIVVPGYGMAVAQAQHKVWEMCQLLIDRGVTGEVRDPPGGGPHARPHERAAGRSRRALRPDLRSRRDQRRVRDRGRGADHRRERRGEPGGAHRQVSPIYGMPILNADKAKNVIVIKRGQGAGFSGIENALFFLDNTRMLYGDGQKAAAGTGQRRSRPG